jgi:hypothetical protein
VEPNPYESPKVEQPLKRSQVAKRAVGFGAILLLTPPAMVIAILTCCYQLAPQHGPIVIWIPFGLLTALMIAAAVVYRPKNGKRERGGLPIATLLATPIFVGLAGGVGFWWATLEHPNAISMGVAFFFPPTITLLAMLFLAWRCR